MPAEFVKCVDALLADPNFKPKNENQTKKDAAYAVCTAQYKKRHDGRTPQQDEASLEPTQEEIETLAFMYEEVARAKTEYEKQKIMKNLDVKAMRKLMRERMK